MSMGWLPLMLIEDEKRRKRIEEEEDEDRRRRIDQASYDRYVNHFERRDYPGGLTTSEKEDLWLVAGLLLIAAGLILFVLGLWFMTAWLFG